MNNVTVDVGSLVRIVPNQKGGLQIAKLLYSGGGYTGSNIVALTSPVFGPDVCPVSQGKSWGKLVDRCLYLSTAKFEWKLLRPDWPWDAIALVAEAKPG